MRTFDLFSRHYIDIVSDLVLANGEKEYEIWLFHEQGCKKELLFGILEESLEDIPEEDRLAEIIRIVEENIDEYL